MVTIIQKDLYSIHIDIKFYKSSNREEIGRLEYVNACLCICVYMFVYMYVYDRFIIICLLTTIKSSYTVLDVR